ncbi:MAG: hypothetical protein SFY69_06975 [Planctomycetota bacterium]|nr:hypothetical protein [Planctomycetota bacterium]
MHSGETCDIAVVTGASLGAERTDRPLAYDLRERIMRAAPGIDAVVCADLQFLNDPALRGVPVVSVGGPHTNALSAYLISRLPTVLAVDGVYAVLLDVEGESPGACCWGRDAAATGAAVGAFAERHLALFLDACAG